MRMVDLIMKTRHGEPLSKNEIEAIVSGFTSGKIPDYQMSAWMRPCMLKKGWEPSKQPNLPWP